MEDCQIVDLYWQRDNRAITETSARYGKYCFAIAFNILSDIQDAEECVNDTWMGAWNAMPVHRPERLAPFLGKITRSVAFNRSRAKYAGKRGRGEFSLALMNWETVFRVLPVQSSVYRMQSWNDLSISFCIPCRSKTAIYSYAATGMWSR